MWRSCSSSLSPRGPARFCDRICLGSVLGERSQLPSGPPFPLRGHIWHLIWDPGSSWFSPRSECVESNSELPDLTIRAGKGGRRRQELGLLGLAHPAVGFSVPYSLCPSSSQYTFTIHVRTDWARLPGQRP